VAVNHASNAALHSSCAGGTGGEPFATILLPNFSVRDGKGRHEHQSKVQFEPISQDLAVPTDTGQNGNYPIKKWAALAALIAAFFYLLLSGAEVATQRSFIMTAIVFVAVMVDRSALTEAVVHPNFGGPRPSAAVLCRGFKKVAHDRLAVWEKSVGN